MTDFTINITGDQIKALISIRDERGETQELAGFLQGLIAAMANERLAVLRSRAAATAALNDADLEAELAARRATVLAQE
jgi:hypothetical protein